MNPTTERWRELATAAAALLASPATGMMKAVREELRRINAREFRIDDEYGWRGVAVHSARRFFVPVTGAAHEVRNCWVNLLRLLQFRA